MKGGASHGRMDHIGRYRGADRGDPVPASQRDRQLWRRAACDGSDRAGEVTGGSAAGEEAQKGKAKKRESGGDRQAAGQGEEKAESPPDRRRYPRRAERRMARHTRGAAPRRTPYPDRSHACEHRAGGRKSRQHGGMVRLGQRRRVDGDAVAGENGAYAGSPGSYGDGFQRL